MMTAEVVIASCLVHLSSMVSCFHSLSVEIYLHSMILAADRKVLLRASLC